MAGNLPTAKKDLGVVLKLKSTQKIALVVSDWNKEITLNLLKAAKKVFTQYNLMDRLIIVHVPGSFEIPLTTSWFVYKKKIVGAIALGCVIQGETKHDDYLNHAITKALSEISVASGKPVLNGVLTTNTKRQALDRAGGKFGNKGEECAIGLIHMLSLKSLIDQL